MKEQFVESVAAWFLLGSALGICIAFFFYIILILKNREINDLKKQIQSKDLEMISLENEIERFNKNLNEAMLQKKALETRANSLEIRANSLQEKLKEIDVKINALNEKIDEKIFERLSKF